jgi:hypothetical protein
MRLGNIEKAILVHLILNQANKGVQFSSHQKPSPSLKRLVNKYEAKSEKPVLIEDLSKKTMLRFDFCIIYIRIYLSLRIFFHNILF